MNRSPEFSVNRARGQGLVEYAVIISLMAVLAIAALILLGSSISGVLADLAASV